MDQTGAEVAVVGIGVYGDALEEASIVLTNGYEFLGLIKLGELQNLCLGKRCHAKAGALWRSEERVHDLRVLLIEDRACRIDELAADSHARGGFLEHRQLQFGQLNRHILFGQSPRNLGMTTRCPSKAHR